MGFDTMTEERRLCEHREIGVVKPGVVVQAYNPSTGEAESGRL
jgi:hypothetical protein